MKRLAETGRRGISIRKKVADVDESRYCKTFMANNIFISSRNENIVIRKISMTVQK